MTTATSSADSKEGATITNGSESASSTFPYLQDWGLSLKELYNLALLFHKEKYGSKALNFSYEENLKLVALTMQVLHGKYDPDTAPAVGALDMIGRDRRLAWQALGDKSRSDSIFEFILTLDKKCPSFKPFVEAHKASMQDKNKELIKSASSSSDQCDEIQKQAEAERRKVEEQKRLIQDALNAQTFHQFKSYAEQQYPGNPEQQAVLIRQLQEQHYEQYTRQVYQQQLYEQHKKAAKQKAGETLGSSAAQSQSHSKRDSENQNDSSETNDVSKETSESKGEGTTQNGDEDSMNDVSSADDHESSIATASMWNRKDIQEFKDSVKAEGGEAIIRINQGESVTIRVPTHKDGSCLFWEFATDSYDIGFGLFFEWTDTDEPVSVHVTDENSSEDDDDDEDIAALKEDIEKGDKLSSKSLKSHAEVVIPVYRRDSHQQVYVGSHVFPGKGVYLLKFDNSYSFWRSKTLYYRVYYTKQCPNSDDNN